MVYLQCAEPRQLVHIIADIPRGGDTGKDTAGENGISAEEHFLSGFIEADAAGGMAGCVQGLKLEIA